MDRDNTVGILAELVVHLHELAGREAAATRDLADFDLLAAAEVRNARYAHFARLARVMVYASGRPLKALETLKAIPELTKENQIEASKVGAWLSDDPVLNAIRKDSVFQAFAERYDAD